MFADKEHPLVSIVCEVYNHEPFLRKCLDGFVMQKTDFSIEVLIHDDASTDRSAIIIREYKEKYPDLFFPIYQSENQYSQGINIWTTHQFPRARGKYIAICEGDDYWTDPLKLQKQVDYLEKHPTCTLCFHNAIIHWYDCVSPDAPFSRLEDKDYTAMELCDSWITPTASLVFQKRICTGYTLLMSQHPHFNVGDVPLVLFAAQYGKIHALNYVMSVYGRHPGSFTDFTDATKTFARARCWEEYHVAFGKELDSVTKPKYIGLYILSALRSLKEKKFCLFFHAFFRGILRHPLEGVKAAFSIPKERRNRTKIQVNHE